VSRWDLFTGVITAGGFTSGEMVVVGAWRTSPIGPLVDVMWVRPDGERVLLAPTPEARDVSVRLIAGRRVWRSWLFAARPRPLRRSPAWLHVEDVLGRPVVGRLIGGAEGVRAVGVAPGGQRECYGVDDWRPIIDGALTIDGADRGALVPLRSDLGIGLSSFPTRPAAVHVGTLVERDRGGPHPAVGVVGCNR
jgi:hypothetical protein